jgi:uncharacterized protein
LASDGEIEFSHLWRLGPSPHEFRRYIVSLGGIPCYTMSLASLSNQKVVSVETVKKNGEAVRSPVWVVEDGGLLYIRSDANSWKIKRIKRNPSVRVAPSSWGGKIKGDWVKGEAQFVQDESSGRILELFTRKYGIMARILNFYNKLRARKYVTVAIKVQ